MLEPESTLFVLVSFEGPDVYSQAGGLGVRELMLEYALSPQLSVAGDPTTASLTQ